MLAQVDIRELDGQLGILPPSSGLMQVIIGPADDGPFYTPAAFARTKDIQSNYVGGPSVESAAYSIERLGRPIVFIRTEASNDGAYGLLDTSGFTGTTTPSLDSAT